MNFIIAIVLIVHAIPHLVGFLVYWKIVNLEEMPFSTTQMAGQIDVGSVGIRVIGSLWLLAAIAFIAAGIGVITGQAWWLQFTFIVSVFSLLLSILGWPDSKIGVLVNIAIIALLLVKPF